MLLLWVSILPPSVLFQPLPLFLASKGHRREKKSERERCHDFQLGACWVQHRPNKVALVFNGERRYTWREFSLNVNKLANVLISRGIRQNDKVASILPNSVEMVEL